MAVNAENSPPVPKRPNWFLFCTGGLLAAGGLGWCLRIAYAEQPRMTVVSYLTGTAGIGLMNMAVVRKSGKKASTILSANWWMMCTGGMLAGGGFGYCLKIAMMENPKTAALAYTVGTIGYVIINSVLYTVLGNEKIAARTLTLTNKEIADIVTSANARFHYMGFANQCEYCKAHVEKEIRKRKEAEKRSKGINAKGGFLGNIGKLCLYMVCGEDQLSRAAVRASSRDGLKREMSKTGQYKNIQKKMSDRRETKKCSAKFQDDSKTSNTAVRRMNLSREPEPRNVDDNSRGYRRPMTTANAFPDEKSTQTERRRRITSTQTEESLLHSNKPDDGDYPITTDSQSEDDGALVEDDEWSTPPELESESHQLELLEFPTEDQQLKTQG